MPCELFTRHFYKIKDFFLQKKNFTCFIFTMITSGTIKLNNSISFGTFFRDVESKDGKIIYRGDTAICRNDIYFPDVIDFLDNKYKNTPKVNVIMHACSDGEEAYSFLSVLLSQLEEKAAKFLPLDARDIDLNHLKLAKRGIYNITKSEYEIANESLNGNFYMFFEPMPTHDSKDPRLKYTRTVKVEHSLKSLVKFKQADIIEDVKNMDLKNTVLFARNFWPYLSQNRVIELANLLSMKADNSFTLIIGEYDRVIVDLLCDNGFVEVAENVFEKPKNFEYDSRIYDYEYSSIY